MLLYQIQKENLADLHNNLFVQRQLKNNIWQALRKYYKVNNEMDEPKKQNRMIVA